MISEKVKKLLEEHSTELRKLSKVDIEKALISNGIDPTEELVDFEHFFGGLKLIVWDHEFQFGLLWGGGFPFNPELASIEYGEELGYKGEKTELYCSSNNCFDNFIIDKKGRIFGSEDLIFESFEDFIIEFLNKTTAENIS